MSDTTYIDYVQPAVSAEWLNEINDHVWHDTPVAGTTVHNADNIKVIPFDDISSTTVQTALEEINTYLSVGTGAVETTVQNKLREFISVKDFGAVGDGVTDDTAAIQATIDYVSTYDTSSVVTLPVGTYRITSNLVIRNNYVCIEGTGIVGAQGTTDVLGSSLLWDSTSGGDILRIGKDDGVSWIYGVGISNLSIRCTSAASAVPANGLHLKNISECFFDNCFISGYSGTNGINAAIWVQGGTIASFLGITTANCVYGVLLDTLPSSNVNTSLWFSGMNMWNMSVAAVLNRGNIDSVSFRDVWAEFTPVFFSGQQLTGKSIVSNQLLFDNVYLYNSTDSPYKRSQFMRFDALAENTQYTYTQTIVRGCKHYGYNNNTALETTSIAILTNANTSPATVVRGLVIEDCAFWGLNSVTNAQVVGSDDNSTSVMFRGYVISSATYQGSDTTVAKFTGLGKYVDSTLNTGNSYFTRSNGFTFNNLAIADVADTLAHYSSNTWTPTDASGAALSFTGIAGNCFYTRIGNVVTATFNIVFPTTASGANVSIGGLPFQVKLTSTNVSGGCISYTNAGISPSILAQSATSTFTLYSNTGAAIVNSALSGKTIRGVLTYLV